jgi:hypothetical protein
MMQSYDYHRRIDGGLRIMALYRPDPESEPEPVMIINIQWMPVIGTLVYVAIAADGETIIERTTGFQVIDGDIIGELRAFESGS